MLPSASNWEAIMAAMTCLCASSKDGTANNFISTLTNELNIQYPNQTRVFITPEDLQQIQTKISDLEKSFVSLQAQQTKVLAAIKALKTPTFCTKANDPNQFTIMSIKIPEYDDNKRVVCIGDWLIILLRRDGNIDFFRPWQEYKRGFGKPQDEIFVGLEMLHILTKSKPYELMISLRDFDDEERTARYDRFQIGSEAEGYPLKVLGSYSGDAGDSLRKHAGRKFTTRDHDNDMNHLANCAELSAGAWWYTDEPCHESNLFGHYSAIPEQSRGRGIVWKTFRGFDYSLKEVIMMIRPSQKC